MHTSHIIYNVWYHVNTRSNKAFFNICTSCCCCCCCVVVLLCMSPRVYLWCVNIVCVACVVCVYFCECVCVCVCVCVCGNHVCESGTKIKTHHHWLCWARPYENAPLLALPPYQRQRSVRHHRWLSSPRFQTHRKTSRIWKYTLFYFVHACFHMETTVCARTYAQKPMSQDI